jgi:hypothetical protein
LPNLMVTLTGTMSSHLAHASSRMMANCIEWTGFTRNLFGIFLRGSLCPFMVACSWADWRAGNEDLRTGLFAREHFLCWANIAKILWKVQPYFGRMELYLLRSGYIARDELEKIGTGWAGGRLSPILKA